MKTFTFVSNVTDFSLQLSAVQVAHITDQGDIGSHVIRIANKVTPTFTEESKAALPALLVELNQSFTGLTVEQMIRTVVWACAWNFHTSPAMYED